MYGGGGHYLFNPGLFEDGKEYTTNVQFTGELKITNLDQINLIISGTFWFDAVNDEGEVVKIREGRFDMQYVQ